MAPRGGVSGGECGSSVGLQSAWEELTLLSHLSLRIEWELKWALGSTTTNKTIGGDGIPVELFQILKDDAVKVPSR